jgi:hypothetical protein
MADFNLAKIKNKPCLKNTASTSNTATCSVVINNTSQSPNQIVERDIQLEDLPEEIEGETNELKLYKLLSLTLAGILKTNNPKLFANLIDNSGKVILDAVNLVKLIALITNTKEEDVNIEYQTQEEPTCWSKIKPVKIIENIKVQHKDFKLCYNYEYNVLSDTYAISLKKFIVPITALD